MLRCYYFHVWVLPNNKMLTGIVTQSKAWPVMKLSNLPSEKSKCICHLVSLSFDLTCIM